MSSLSIKKNSARGQGYVLHGECVVPAAVDKVFDFFSDAGNLETLTPKWLQFTVLTPTPIEMGEGQMIDYKLRVHGIPLRWQSEITAWEPTSRFVDEARRSPYRWWHHEHRFEEAAAGTRVIDKVEYGVPGGALVHWLIVRRDVKAIFEYRQQKLKEIFRSE